jgi:hypothetical protein
MKAIFASLAATLAIGMFLATNLSADDKGPAGGAGKSVGEGGHAGGSVGGGGGAGVDVRAGGDAARASVRAGEAARLNVQAAPNRGRVDVDVNRGRVGVDANRDRNLDSVRANVRTPRQDYFVERGNRIGDSQFDRHGIGIVDDRAFVGRSDNRWRYRNWNNEWWYWLPGGYWSYYRGDRWNRYEPDSYIAYNDYYNNTPAPAVAATPTSNGPYYEDQNGFYYMDQQGQRVYDPQIQRVGVAGAVGPTAR